MTPPPLTIQVLGRFAVWRGETLLAPGDWGRDKARQLLQYMVTQRGQLVLKERITAELWPALAPDKADRDFKVALNALNSALEPDRPPRSLAVYLTREGTSYGLNPAAPIRSDVAQFEAAITAGGQSEPEDPAGATAHYRQALELYQGAYLPDALYDDWASAERERLATLYLATATRLARLLLDAGATPELILWCQRVIAADPCWEEAYRLLMQGHLRNGNRPLAIRTYEQCRQTLAAELGIDPMPETTRLYRQITT